MRKIAFVIGCVIVAIVAVTCVELPSSHDGRHSTRVARTMIAASAAKTLLAGSGSMDDVRKYCDSSGMPVSIAPYPHCRFLKMRSGNASMEVSRVDNGAAGLIMLIVLPPHKHDMSYGVVFEDMEICFLTPRAFESLEANGSVDIVLDVFEQTWDTVR